MFQTEKEMATHSSTLAWKIPWMEEPGRLQSVRSQRVGHDWATSLSFYSFFWRKKWQPTPVFLPGESDGWRGLVGCGLWGCKESDTTKQLTHTYTHTHTHTMFQKWAYAHTHTHTHTQCSRSELMQTNFKDAEVAQSCPTLCSPIDCCLPGSSVQVGFHFLLQGVFPTEGSNLGLLHCRQTFEPPGKPQGCRTQMK